MSERKASINFKHSQEDKQRIDYIAKKGSINASEAIRRAIKFTYQSLHEVLDFKDTDQEESDIID